MGDGFSELWRSGQNLRTEVLPENQALGTAEAEGVEGLLRDRKAEGNPVAQTPSFTGRRRKRGWSGQKDREMQPTQAEGGRLHVYVKPVGRSFAEPEEDRAGWRS